MEALLPDSGWYAEPKKFRCLSGTTRELEVIADTQKMRFGVHKVDINLKVEAGAWESNLPVQAKPECLAAKNRRYFGGPPLAWALVPGVFLALLFGLSLRLFSTRLVSCT